MEEIKVCRICLTTDVKMWDLQSHPLSSYFESVVNKNMLTILNAPPYACYECATLLKKYYFFKQKSLRSQAILCGLIDNNGEVSPSELKKVDRQGLVLTSTLALQILEGLTVDEYGESLVKVEHIESTPEETIEVNYVKEEMEIAFDLRSPDRYDSDDNEPLSLHKEKKIKEIEFRDGEEEEDEPNSNEETSSSSPLPELNRKRGRPKKVKDPEFNNKRTRRSSKFVTPFSESSLDLGAYITVINLSVEEQIEEINKRKESSNYLNSPYQCHLCYKGFIDTHAWQHHVGKHSPSAGDNECAICKVRFKDKRSLQKHSSNHEKKYACKSCPYISSNTTQAKQHQGWHKGVTYKCKFCDDIFSVWTSYMSHVRIKHPSNFICGVCGYSFVSQLGLTMHKTMMHKDVADNVEGTSEEGPYCAECDVKFISVAAYKRHMIMSTKHTKTTETVSNGCRTCGEIFKNAEEMRVHHRKEHARKRPKNYGKKPPDINFPAKCEHCSEIIPNGREHWNHYRRAHQDKKYPIQKNYICDICGKRFRGNAFLVYHKRTHTSEREYKCSQCDKSFYNRTNLQVHMKTHSDVRPYPCSVCFKAFKCKGALTRHFRSHTGQKPYECEVCGKAFSQSNSRKLHVATVHLKQPAPYVSRRRKNVDKDTPHNDFVYGT